MIRNLIFRLGRVRADQESTRIHQDRSLAYVLWLLMFLVFVPMGGVHLAFMLSAEPAAAHAVQGKSGDRGKHG
jgi:hypothetical protein